jgi:hypothetical protein
MYECYCRNYDNIFEKKRRNRNERFLPKTELAL